MSPILTGVIASGISGHLTPPWSPEGAYDALASTTLTSTASSITFAGIPSGYKHLQIRFSANIAAVSGANFRFNGDSASNYRTQYLLSNGTSVSSVGGGADTQLYGSVYGQGYDGGTNIFTSGIMDVLDYSSNSKIKTTRSVVGVDRNGTGAIQQLGGYWYSANPINSITYIVEGANDLAIGTTVSLYGVK